MKKEIEPKFYSTGEFADLIGVHPVTIRKNYSENGHYQNIKPKKISSSLKWPRDLVHKFIGSDE